MAPSDITLTQDSSAPGIVVNVSITDNVTGSVHVVFNDQIQNSSEDSLYSQTISSTVWNAINTDVSGVRTKEITLPVAAYETVPNGDIISVMVQTGTLDETQAGLVYKQAVPFTIVSVTDGVESAIVKIQLDNTIYNQNKATEDSFGIIASMPTNYTGDDVTVSHSVSEGLATINVTDIVSGTYEITIGTYNNYGLKQKSQVVTVSTDPAAATATAFYTFATEDISAGTFDLEFADKDYSQYTSVNVFADFKQNDSAVGSKQTVYTSGSDVSGGLHFEDNKPTKYVMPSNIFNGINGYIGSSSNKFSIELYVEGVTTLAGETVERTFHGTKTTTQFYKDIQLSAPIVTLDAIDWTTGEQSVKADSGDGYDGYTATFDLSGSTTNVAMDASGDAIKTYGYNELLPNANGDYKALSVTVQRADINFLNAVNPPMNKSDATDLAYYLKAIKSAEAPTVVNFTDITSTHDGSIEFAYVEASANTDLLGRLFTLPLGADAAQVGDDQTVDIPLATASNEVISFESDLAPGTKYEMRANTRFDMMSGFNARYNVLNGDSRYLLSATTSQLGFFTDAPTMNLQVRPTGATNVMGTVRMTCEAKANDIKKMVVYVKDVCGQIHESEVIVGDGHTDTCGNLVLNSGGTVNNFNREVIQDFVFGESIELGASDRFMFGLVDTPDSVDGFNVDEAPTDEVVTLNAAIIAYDAGVVAYESALDASKNYTEDEDWSEDNELYLGWTASAEALKTERNDLSNNLIPASEENVESLTSDRNLKNAEYNAAVQTYGSIDGAVNAWVTAFDDKLDGDAKRTFKHTPLITYSVFTASGEVIGDIQEAEGVKIPVPSVGYTAEYLATLVADKHDLMHTANGNYLQANTDKTNAETTNATLDADLVTLNGNASTLGSIEHALAQKAGALTDRDAHYDALVLAVATAKGDLVGKAGTIYGTVTIPKDGLIKTMNEERSALSAVVQGIEKFSVPALAV